MHTATDTLVTIACLEFAPGSGATRFTRQLTPFVTRILQERCRQEGFPPGTANMAELVYLRMATHATFSFDRDRGRDILVNTVSRNRMRDLLNGTSKDTIDRAMRLLELVGVIRAVDPDLLTDLARKYHAMPFEIEPDALCAAHDHLRERHEKPLRAPRSQPTASTRESVPVAVDPAGNDDRASGNRCRHPESQIPGIQKDHHDSDQHVDPIPTDIADADGLSAFLGDHPEAQDLPVGNAGIGTVARVFESAARPGTPALSLSALPKLLRQHPWTWRAMAHLLHEVKASPKLLAPAGWLVDQLKSREMLDRLSRRPLDPPRPVTRPTIVPVAPVRPPDVSEDDFREARRRMADQRPDVDPDALARDILADDVIVRMRGMDSPLSQLFLSRASYEVCRQLTASQDLPPFQAMTDRVAHRVAGI